MAAGPDGDVSVLDESLVLFDLRPDGSVREARVLPPSFGAYGDLAVDEDRTAYLTATA